MTYGPSDQSLDPTYSVVTVVMVMVIVMEVVMVMVVIVVMIVTVCGQGSLLVSHHNRHTLQ
jgi:hypothetical protein